MKQSSELNQLIDELIEVYKVQKTRRKQIMVKEVEDFQRFFYAITGLQINISKCNMLDCIILNPTKNQSTKIEVKQFTQFITEARTTKASQEAKRLGLVGDGHGDWYDRQGNLKAKTVKGELKMFSGQGSGEDEMGTRI